MSRSIYFVRHGQSLANAQGVAAGSGYDAPLTEKGENQARRLAQNFKGINFDLIVSSPLLRVQTTAKILIDELGLQQQPVTRQEFNERDVGEFTGKPEEEYYAFEAGGGDAKEKTQDMQKRVQQGLEWLTGQVFQNALVITHSEVMRMIQILSKNLPIEDFADLPRLNNGEYLRIELQ
jgi:probable phosphoglycerate mutase